MKLSKVDILFFLVLVLIVLQSCTKAKVLQNEHELVFEESFNEIQRLIETSRFDDAFKITKRILNREDLSNSWRSEFLNSQGNIFFFMGRFQEAIEHYDEALKIREDLKDRIKTSYSLTNIGMVYNELGNLDKAQYYLNKALEIQLSENDSDGLLSTYLNLGNLNYKNGDFTSSVHFYQKAMNYHVPDSSLHSLSGIYNNLGAVYQELGNLDSAYYFHHEAIQILEKYDDIKGLAISFNNLGAIAMLQDNIEQGRDYFLKSIQLYDSIGTRAYAIEAYTNLGLTYLLSGEYDLANHVLDTAISYAHSLNLELPLSKIYAAKIQIDTLKYDYRSAVSHYQIYNTLLHNQLEGNFAKQLEYATLNYEIEMAENENLLLKSKVDAQNKKIITSLIGIIALVILIFMLWLYYNQRTLANRLIEKQLIQEIQILKNDILLKSSLDKNEIDVWDKTKIDNIFDHKLNDSDWRILEIIKSEPMLNNKQISELVNLSVEGVRSSLKKMYRLADLEKRSPNQRLNLIRWILRSVKE